MGRGNDSFITSCTVELHGFNTANIEGGIGGKADTPLAVEYVCCCSAVYLARIVRNCDAETFTAFTGYL